MSDESDECRFFQVPLSVRAPAAGAVGRAIVKFSMVGRKPDQAAAAEEDDEVSSDEDGL